MRKCSKCGYESEDKWTCPECGEDLVEIEEPKEKASSGKPDMILKNYDNDAYKPEETTENKYDAVKKSTLYHVMSIILIIWSVLTIIGFIYQCVKYGFVFANVLGYGFEFAGSFIPGIMGVKWLEKENAYKHIKTALIVMIVFSGIAIIITLGVAILLFGIPIALYIIGAVRQMNFLKEAGFKPEKDK